MAHIGRIVKNIDGGSQQQQQQGQSQIQHRLIKTPTRSSLKSNFVLVEDLIQLIETVAHTLQSGINNKEQMQMLMQNLKTHGQQLETMSKDTLDRAFVVFRNASQDERLNLMTRLNLLQLIELRAKGWEDSGFNAYYQTKQAISAEIPEALPSGPGQVVVADSATAAAGAYLSTSPTFGGSNLASHPSSAAAAANAAVIAAVGSPQQIQLLLGPGEVIRNSGKFPRPTKIPGKTYYKDEVVIRNGDSGKVMGIKGRRVHMIEELSETVISFQRVNPGAKERLVQITGPSEEKINYGKNLIEDTIRRNASPVRLEPSGSVAGQPGGGGGGGSCSSLASSNSDDGVVQPRSAASGGGGSSLSNRLSFNSAQNFMTGQQAAAAAVHHHQHILNTTSAPSAVSAAATAAAGKSLRANQQILLHSYSTNDASLGEYKYTVNVGQRMIKITGDCCDLVRMAKLVLDDYFSSSEFLASFEAGAAFDGSMMSPLSAPSTPLGGGLPPQFIGGSQLQASTPLADSGIAINYMASQYGGSNSHDADDDVFVLEKSASSAQSNGLVRSRRSHFSRKDASAPEAVTTSGALSVAAGGIGGGSSDGGTAAAGRASDDGRVGSSSTRIVYELEHLLFYSKSPHSWALPAAWPRIIEKFPTIARNQDLQDESDRFDGEKYLESMKSTTQRNITAADESSADADNQDNE